jgi:hypothetical protein
MCNLHAIWKRDSLQIACTRVKGTKGLPEPDADKDKDFQDIFFEKRGNCVVIDFFHAFVI